MSFRFLKSWMQRINLNVFNCFFLRSDAPASDAGSTKFPSSLHHHPSNDGDEPPPGPPPPIPPPEKPSTSNLQSSLSTKPEADKFADLSVASNTSKGIIRNQHLPLNWNVFYYFSAFPFQKFKTSLDLISLVVLPYLLRHPFPSGLAVSTGTRLAVP